MIHANELRGMAIFESLSLHQLERVAAAAADIDLGDGEYMVHEGEIPAFWVVVEGRLEITKRVGGFERVIATRGYGEHFGEVPLALGSTTFANARAAGHARAMRLEPTMFHELLSLAPSLGSAVSNAIVARVGELGRMTTESPASAATIVGNRQDLACHDLRDFLARNQIPFEWFPPEDELLAERWPELYELRDQGPVAKLRDGAVLVRPTDRELAAALGLCVAPQHDEYDVVIVGGGPGGLAAAVYGASEGLRTVVIENEAPGGQAGTSSRIENYVGFPSGLSGDDLGNRAYRQALRLGAEIVVTRRVEKLEPGDAAHDIVLDGKTRIRSRGVVIATGVEWRHLDIPGADALTGRGIYYGAARTEALATRGKDIYLVGAGNSAGQAAMFFSNYARSVTLLVRGDSLARTMSAYLIEQIDAKRNIRTELRSEVVAVAGSGGLERITVLGPQERSMRDTEALFVFIGAEAETGWLPAELMRNGRGYILTGLDAARDVRATWPLARDPFFLETSVPRIFAVGDVRCGSIKRVAAAVGEGSMAIALLHEALAEPDMARTSEPVAH